MDSLNHLGLAHQHNSLRQWTSGTTRVRLFALGLRRDPHGSVKQIHHEELEDGDKERPIAFPNIMLKETDPGIQQLHGAGQRTQD